MASTEDSPLTDHLSSVAQIPCEDIPCSSVLPLEPVIPDVPSDASVNGILVPVLPSFSTVPGDSGIVDNVASEPTSISQPSEPVSQSFSAPEPSKKPRKSPAHVVYRADELFRIGDYCYFETSASGPYQIRRLEELIRVENRIDVKVVIYSRKSDLPPSIQRQISGFVDGEEDFLNPSSASCSYDPTVSCRLRRRFLSQFSASELLDHGIWSREVFVNRDCGGTMTEILPTSLIRGRCHVLHHLEGMEKKEYTRREDVFFAWRAWWPPEEGAEGEDGMGQVAIEKEKSIQYDMHSSLHQALLPDFRPEPPDPSTPDHSSLLWKPDNGLSEEPINTFFTLATATNLHSRSLDYFNSLCRTVPAHTLLKLALRDYVQEAAYHLLHRAGYDLEAAVRLLVDGGKIWSVRETVERWDDEDLAYFMSGLAETQRDLNAIYKDWMPWKSLGEIVRFYYLYKCSGLYSSYKSTKILAHREQGHIASLHIPLLEGKGSLLKNVADSQICYGCSKSSTIWHAWIGSKQKVRNRIRPLCKSCWAFWKRYACLRRPWKKPALTRFSQGESSVVSSFPASASKTSSSPAIAKSLLLTHRSPPPPDYTPPQPRSAVSSPVKSGKKSDQRDFIFKADADWTVARRVASESLYVPRQVALYPQLAMKDMATVGEYVRNVPSLVVTHYLQQPLGRRLKRPHISIMDHVVNKITRLSQ